MQRNELVNLANKLGFDASTIVNDSKLEAHLKYLLSVGAADNGTLATGTLTSDDTDMDADDQVTIGNITYTFVTALSEAKATSTFTVSGNAEEGERVQIDGITYTFRAVPVNPYDVDIGASAAVSLDNLKAAINDSGTEGTTYGTGTDAHPTVTAEANADTTQEVTAKRFGVYGNKIIVSTTVADGAWDAGTLEGGVDPVPFEVLIGAGHAAALDNFKSAINDTGTEGTHYSTGTYAHPQVTATTNSDTTQVVEARDFSVNNVATTDNEPDHLSWGATTLGSGVPDYNAVNETTVAQAGSGQNANA